jgi:hypothetical protein
VVEGRLFLRDTDRQAQQPPHCPLDAGLGRGIDDWVTGAQGPDPSRGGRESQGLDLRACPVVLFIGLLRAYLRFVRGTDELQRLIQLQALAVGFGAGILLLVHWELFEFLGAPGMDPSDAVMVPIFAWIFSQLYLGWRYR